MEGEALPGLVALDEPTRGMDRGRKDELVELIETLAARGAGVVVATHDVEFAAEFAERVVLLGDGVVIADGAARDVLSGGWYFATEVARVLDLPGVVTPEQGAAALPRRWGGSMSWELVSFLILGAVLLAGFAWYERSRPPSQVVALVAALAALAIAGRIAFAAFPNVKPTTDIVIFAGYALGGAPGFRGRRSRRAGLQLLVRPGAVDARGRWRPGASAASSARRWRWAGATSAASASPPPAGSLASSTALCSTSR